MKKNIWKIISVILSIAFLYVWHDNAQVGRYKLSNIDYTIIDTKTGIFIQYDPNINIDTFKSLKNKYRDFDITKDNRPKIDW